MYSKAQQWIQRANIKAGDFAVTGIRIRKNLRESGRNEVEAAESSEAFKDPTGSAEQGSIMSLKYPFERSCPAISFAHLINCIFVDDVSERMCVRAFA